MNRLYDLSERLDYIESYLYQHYSNGSTYYAESRQTTREDDPNNPLLEAQKQFLGLIKDYLATVTGHQWDLQLINIGLVYHIQGAPRKYKQRGPNLLPELYREDLNLPAPLLAILQEEDHKRHHDFYISVSHAIRALHSNQELFSPYLVHRMLKEINEVPVLVPSTGVTGTMLSVAIECQDACFDLNIRSGACRSPVLMELFDTRYAETKVIDLREFPDIIARPFIRFLAGESDGFLIEEDVLVENLRALAALADRLLFPGSIKKWITFLTYFMDPVYYDFMVHELYTIHAYLVDPKYCSSVGAFIASNPVLRTLPPDVRLVIYSKSHDAIYFVDGQPVNAPDDVVDRARKLLL